MTQLHCPAKIWTALTLMIAMLCLGSSPAMANWWRFEDAKNITKAEAQGPALTLHDKGGKLTQDRQVILPYVYDPISGTTYANKSSIKLTSSKDAWAYLEGKVDGLQGSFTLELFAKPFKDPKRDCLLLSKTHATAAMDLRFDAKYNNRWKQTYYSAYAMNAEGKPDGGGLGHYVTEARINPKAQDWVHLAMIYNADTNTATYYLNGWLNKTIKLSKDVNIDNAPLLIGGTEKGLGWAGWLDEIRLTHKALTPLEFLKARSEKLPDNTKVSNSSTKLPPGIGYINVKNFGAIGDGKADDTWAFKRALKLIGNKIPAMYNTLYVPKGTYMISDMLHMNRFTIIQGEGKDNTLLKLVDKSKVFSNPKKPVPLLRASSTPTPPGSNKAVNGSSIGLYVFDISFHTGSGNPGAKGVEYHSNNHGAFEDVNITSGDGAGVVGLDLTHKTAGPSLIQHVTIKGFDYGVTFKYQEYSNTLEHIRLEGQRKAAIWNEANIMALRKIHSINTVPALISKGGNSMISILDSTFEGGKANATAIESEGAIYARNITVKGYGTSIKKRKMTWHGWKKKPSHTWEDLAPVKGDVKEYVGDYTVTPFGTEATSLNLPIEETPLPEWGDIKKDWVNIKDLAYTMVSYKDEKGRKRDVRDYATGMQQAIDDGAKTIYFPDGRYHLGKAVTLGNKLVRLFGMRSKLVAVPGTEGPILIYDNNSASHVLAVERLDLGHIEHRGKGTLVLHHTTPSLFTNAPRCGKLFLEDVMGHGWRFNHPQKVWCRQWNPEQHWNKYLKKDPKRKFLPDIVSNGATIWSLGFKTEYDSQKLSASNGAKTEILGGFIYPVVKGIPEDRPVFTNVDSDFSAIYGISIYTAGWKLHVHDTQNGVTKLTTIGDMSQCKSRLKFDLYSSRRQ